jgi:hypothetical protein
MKEIFTAIENKTDYKFLYRDDDLENLAVNINATDKPLDEILNLALMNSNRTYKILADNLIVIMHDNTLQSRIVAGTVTDATTHELLIGVNIVIEGTTKGVSRDAVDLLQGKVAGLLITKGNGDVTGSNTIRLRGTSSLTGSSEPFVVIDGISGEIKSILKEISRSNP